MDIRKTELERHKRVVELTVEKLTESVMVFLEYLEGHELVGIPMGRERKW